MNNFFQSDKDFADGVDARNRLRNAGYRWKTCNVCHGVNVSGCCACNDKGGRWQSPDEIHLEHTVDQNKEKINLKKWDFPFNR